jgi:transposase, IS30 family
VERLSVRERERIAELVAEGAPFWRLRQEVPRSRYAIYRAVRRLLRPPAPESTRSALRLSLAEREEISRGLARGRVAAGHCPAAGPITVDGVAGGRPQRRARRLSGVPGRSCGAAPHAQTQGGQAGSLRRLRAVVEAKLELRWSPQQIAGWLSVEFPDDAEMRVSHETIYLSLFVQSRVRCARNSPATCGCVTALDVPAASRPATARATSPPW